MKVSTCSHRPILEPCELEFFQYQVDPYVGCQHLCHYCYALNTAETDWSEEIFMHKDIKGQLSKELENIPPQPIYLGYRTDSYQPCEAEYFQTRKVLELLVEKKFSVSILTKSDLVLRDVDLLKQMEVASVCFSIAFTDNRIRRQFEGNTIDIEARVEAMRKLKEEGIGTAAMICPVIPYVTDVLPLIEMVADHTDSIWLYKVSMEQPSSKNYQNVLEILSCHYPDKKDRILRTATSGKDVYWTKLREELQQLQEERKLNLLINL